MLLYSNEIDLVAAKDILCKFVICAQCASNSRLWQTSVLLRFKLKKFLESHNSGEELTENEDEREVKINEPSLDNDSSSSNDDENEATCKTN